MTNLTVFERPDAGPRRLELDGTVSWFGNLPHQEDQLVVRLDHFVELEAEALVRAHPVAPGLPKPLRARIVPHDGFAYHHSDVIRMGVGAEQPGDQLDDLLIIDGTARGERATLTDHLRDSSVLSRPAIRARVTVPHYPLAKGEG